MSSAASFCFLSLVGIKSNEKKMQLSHNSDANNNTTVWSTERHTLNTTTTTTTTMKFTAAFLALCAVSATAFMPQSQPAFRTALNSDVRRRL
jgi:hypothetical protein